MASCSECSYQEYKEIITKPATNDYFQSIKLLITFLINRHINWFNTLCENCIINACFTNFKCQDKVFKCLLPSPLSITIDSQTVPS